jgi:nucleotide-binding universal stress UspA family protein
MYKRILVCFDESPTSSRALLAALQLAALRDSAIRIVHVLEHPMSLGGYPYGPRGEHYLHLAQRHAQDVLKGALDTADLSGQQADIRLIDGAGQRLGEAIAAEAQSWSADLVVVGSHGRHGVRRALLGSGAEQILRLAHVPVLVVRGEAESTDN